MRARDLGLLLPLVFVSACSSTSGPAGASPADGRRDASFAGMRDGGSPRDAHDRRHDAGPLRDARVDASHTVAPGDAARDVPSLADAAEEAAAPRDATADASSFQPTTSVAALTQNNTSGCTSSEAPCTAAWSPSQTVHYSSGSFSGTTKSVTGFWDPALPAGPRAPGSTDGRVSKVPMSTLLPGYSVPIWVETQNWWGSGGHIDNGEVSSSGQQIMDQVADQRSRGFAGQVVDWYGPGTSADKALAFIRSSAEASGGTYGFAVMIDKGYFTSCGETVSCLNSALTYISASYGASSAYLKDTNGKPRIFFFINEYYTTQYPLLSGSGINDDGTSFVVYEPNGFPGHAPPNTLGEYAWVNPADGATETMTSGSEGSFTSASDFGLKDLTSFFSAAAQSPTSFAVSEAHKGFDDNLAGWSGNRIIDQQCGLTWLETFAHTESFGGSSSYVSSFNYLQSGKHLDLLMVDTWDDYEEGSELETGIDNCLGALSVSLEGSTLTWTPTWNADPMNGSVVGSEVSLYAYSIFAAKPGETDLMWLDDVPCTGGVCGHSVDVSTLGLRGGPYVLYVEAVGLPSIVSTLSAPSEGTFTKAP